jgi:hypothetical protein
MVVGVLRAADDLQRMCTVAQHVAKMTRLKHPGYRSLMTSLRCWPGCQCWPPASRTTPHPRSKAEIHCRWIG